VNDFKEIIEAKLNKNMEKLHEASLGRIWQHVVNSDKKSFAILTSWRYDKSVKENKRDFQSLKTTVRSLGYGFVQLKGHWRECQDENVPYNDCPEEGLVDSVEPSLFIIGISKQEAESLSNENNQDGYVFAGPETDGNVNLIFKNGGNQDLGTLRPQTLGFAYSELLKSKHANQRYFKFEAIEYPAQSWIQTLIEQEVRKTLKNI